MDGIGAVTLPRDAGGSERHGGVLEVRAVFSTDKMSSTPPWVSMAIPTLVARCIV